MNWTYLKQNWKSSLQSVLTVTLAITGYLLTTGALSVKVVTILGSVQGAAKVVLGLLQQDAGTTMATLPGSSVPQAVASHETPDSPSATPVVK